MLGVIYHACIGSSRCTRFYSWQLSLSIVLAIAAVVVFQPELRRALEKLGEKNLLSNINPFDKNRENERFSDETADSIVSACYDMGRVCTGALIVVEQAIRLNEYEMTGIELDCKVSSQVLINIFEHNTPLHDGAVIIRGDRITSATCYLPLSDNMSISKDLGTRHEGCSGDERGMRCSRDCCLGRDRPCIICYGGQADTRS